MPIAIHSIPSQQISSPANRFRSEISRERKKPMKTKYAWISILMSLALVLGVAGVSMADAILFKASGNDVSPGQDKSLYVEQTFSNEFGQTIDLEYYAKVEGNTGTDGGLNLPGGNGTTSGEWETDEPIHYFSVKAGNSYTFWQVGPDFPASAGDWTTAQLTNDKGIPQDISHFTAWTLNGGGPGPGPEPIPEPSTVFLMGLGLASLGVTVRKRKRK